MHPLWSASKRLRLDDLAGAQLLGWTLLVIAAVGFLVLIHKRRAGKPLTRRRRDGTVQTMFVGTAAAVVAAVALVFIYHGRTGGVPHWLLIVSLGVLVLVTLGLPLLDEFRHRNQ